MSGAMKTREEEIEAGKAVERLLGHPAVQEAIAGLRERYIREMTDEDDPARLAIHQTRVRVLADIKQELQSIVDSGTRAELLERRRVAR